MYSAGEKYLDTYTAATLLITDVTLTLTLRSDVDSMMTDFKPQCFAQTCKPPLPQFLKKPADQIIRLNI